MKSNELLEYKKLLEKYNAFMEEYTLLSTTNQMKTVKKYEIRPEKNTDLVAEFLSNEFIVAIDQLNKQGINYEGIGLNFDVSIITKIDNIKNNRIISWDKVNTNIMYFELTSISYMTNYDSIKGKKYSEFPKANYNLKNGYYLNPETINNAFEKRGLISYLTKKNIIDAIENENEISPMVWLIDKNIVKKLEKK